MNNLSGRMESIETLQIRQSSESGHSITTIGILKDQFLVGTATITNTRVTMTLMTLMIVSVPMITVTDQFILGTVNTTAIRAIMTMMTLTSES
jgi:predicted Zn-dependent protease